MNRIITYVKGNLELDKKQANCFYISDIFCHKLSLISEVTVPYNRLI